MVKRIHIKVQKSRGTTPLSFNGVLSKQATDDLTQLNLEMKSRLEWSDIEMLRSILVFLDTQSWVLPEGDDSDTIFSEIFSALEYIASHFREPLEAVGADLALIYDELEECVGYARKYLSILSESYQTIWYKLSISPDSSRWPNILVLSELLFSLPFSNGKVERIFSMLKLVKTDRRTNLHTDTLQDLLEIQVEGPALENFCPSDAVNLWWSSCYMTRRVNQMPRKPYRSRKNATPSEEECSTSSSVPQPSDAGAPSDVMSTSGEEHFSLTDWDTWFDS